MKNCSSNYFARKSWTSRPERNGNIATRCLLGHIIAKVTGTTYEQAITDHVLTPVGMKHSGFGFDDLAMSRPLEHANRSVGYRSCSGEDLQQAGPVTPRPFAAGAMYSTVGDLLLFHKAMMANEIISEDSRNKAWSSCEQQRGLREDSHLHGVA